MTKELKNIHTIFLNFIFNSCIINKTVVLKNIMKSRHYMCLFIDANFNAHKISLIAHIFTGNIHSFIFQSRIFLNPISLCFHIKYNYSSTDLIIAMQFKHLLSNDNDMIFLDLCNRIVVQVPKRSNLNLSSLLLVYPDVD